MLSVDRVEFLETLLISSKLAYNIAKELKFSDWSF